MKTLEDFLTQNSATLSHCPLPEGHRERMEERLRKTYRKKRRTRQITYISTAAAAVIIAFIATPLFVANHNTPILTAQEIEIAELNSYIDMKLQAQVAKIEDILQSKPEIVRMEVTFDLQRLLSQKINDPRQDSYKATRFRTFKHQEKVLNNLINRLQ